MIVNVTTNIASRAGTNVWFYFEADFADLHDLHDALVEDGSIIGHRIDTAPAGPNGRQRQITRRIPCVVGQKSVATIMPADDVVDFVEAA